MFVSVVAKFFATIAPMLASSAALIVELVTVPSITITDGFLSILLRVLLRVLTEIFLISSKLLSKRIAFPVPSFLA